MNGFITKKELSEARMICNIAEPTIWQKKRLVALYIKQHTGQKANLAGDTINDDHLQTAKRFFKPKYLKK